MKKLILIVCLFTAFVMQGCVAYGPPVGGYYYREGIWYYHDGRGREYHENHRYHHSDADERARQGRDHK